MTYFDTYGPFRLARNDGAFQGKQAAFWMSVQDRYRGYEEVTNAIGCYVFCLEYNSIIKPWYVGRTRAQKGFSGEVFQKHKRDIYANLLQIRRGTPLLFLFPLMTPDDRFSQARRDARKVINWLEITLMGLAHSRNPEISNVSGMTYLRNVEVLGLLGKPRGRPFREAQAVKKALLSTQN